MKKIMMTVASLMMLSLVACGSKQKESAEEGEPMTIVGKEVLLTYPTMTAKVKYLSEDKLHWRTTSQDGHIEEGVETLSYERIDGRKFFLNWIEQDGTTVSQVLDLDAMTVSVYMSYADADSGRGGRVADFFKGTVEIR